MLYESTHTQQLYHAFPTLDTHATDYYDTCDLDTNERQGLLRWLKKYNWSIHEVGSNYVHADCPSKTYIPETNTQKELQKMEQKTHGYSSVAESIVATQGWKAMDIHRQKIVQDPLAYLMNGGSWVDAVESCEIYELLCRGGMEQIERNRKALEDEKAQWKTKIIVNHTTEREKNFARIMKENNIKKMSGPCCWVLKRDEVDHTCWSHEHKNSEVEQRLNATLQEIEKYKEKLDKICDDYIALPNPILWSQGEQTIEMIDYLKTQLPLLHGQLWNKPHNCIWLHPGEEGWKEEWVRSYGWTTKEERSAKWKPFWAELKAKEAHNKKQMESAQKFAKVLEQKPQQVPVSAPSKITKLHTWGSQTIKPATDNSAW